MLHFKFVSTVVKFSATTDAHIRLPALTLEVESIVLIQPCVESQNKSY